jgi:hypothetical protein
MASIVKRHGGPFGALQNLEMMAQATPRTML